MRVEVMQEDIDGGCPGDGSNCPVSKAIHRAIGEPVHVATHCGCVLTGKAQSFMNPPEVSAWIRRFDSGLPVESISFDLNLEVLE